MSPLVPNLQILASEACQMRVVCAGHGTWVYEAIREGIVSKTGFVQVLKLQ
jgi:hypothetical protein